MVTIYPRKVYHTTYDRVLNETCCGGRGYGTQMLYNPENILKSSSYASWGEDTTNASGPSGNSAKAIATPSGTRRQPEEIIVTKWDVSSIPAKAKITSLTVETKYFTEGYQNYSYVPGLFTDDTTITLTNKNGKTISSKTIPAPTSTEKERSVKFSSLKMSIYDLRDSQIKIQIGENKQSGVVCKVKIKYIRIKVDYKVDYVDPTPKYKLTASSPNTARFNSDFKYTCTINSTNSYSKKTTFYIQIPRDVTLVNKRKLIHHKSYTNYIVYKADISNKNNTISFIGKSSNTGKKSFYAYLSNYGTNTVKSSITINKPSITFGTSCGLSDADENDNSRGNISKTTTKTHSYMEQRKYVRFYLTLKRTMSKLSNKKETVTVKTNNLDVTWKSQSGVSVKKNTDGTTTITFSKNEVALESYDIYLKDPKIYNCAIAYYDEELNKKQTDTYTFNITSLPLIKKYFKLRLEDGSDVQYNSLSFARGDDLKIPLTYTTKNITDITAENFNIIGQTKKIPIDETEYIKFDISLDTEEDYDIENVLALIEAVDEDGEDCSDIIIGVDNNGVLLESDNNKYCTIKQLSNKSITQLRFAVLSDKEQECTIKIKPYNYDLYGTKWLPCKSVFTEIPNIKISIDSDKNDISSNDEITINYYIENKSDINGKNLKFQLIEPPSFKIVDNGDIQAVPYERTEDGKIYKTYFNRQNRIITFENIEANSQRYIFSVTYRAQRKGKYDFIINTIDNENTIDDDQNKNSYKYRVLVDILSEINAKTLINKSHPYVNDIIDFTIKVENRLKPQNKFIFDISDIGDYTPSHNTEKNFNGKDYKIEYVDCDYGNFIEDTEDNNSIGQWCLENIPANVKYELTLSLRPLKSGIHVIHTDFANTDNVQNSNDNNSIQRFNNKVKVLEAKKELEFNVYQAVTDSDIECPDIDDLIVICDNDYINLGDDIYYIIEVKNNNIKQLSQNINIYGRLPESFLENGIKCSTEQYKPIIDANSNLLSIPIQNLEGCSTCKTFFKVTPAQEGQFIINFMLSTRTADVYNKQLQLTVDSEFNQREIEHEINIYNFEKTNRNYRYEIDNNGEIFKFFNKGDRTVRPIETEKYNINLIETYKGDNLKKIVEKIKENSQYIEPVFLRVGNNKLADKGYELYPDGFIRRFGLMQSEVFHHTNQLPTITNLGEKALKWDIDDWGLKPWAGDPYDNGIFDLTVDYSKIPSNFSILDTDIYGTNKLQNIINKTKPYGTKGICYYGVESKLSFKIDINNISVSIGNSVDLLIKFTDIFLITTFNRHDSSLAIFYDIIDLHTKIDYELACEFAFNYIDNNNPILYPDDDIFYTTMDTEIENICVYDDIDKRFYIEDCMDIVHNLYDTNNNTNNIDITFPYQMFDIDDEPTYLYDYQFMHCANNCVDGQFIGYQITYKNTVAKIGYKKDDINHFEGFVLEVDGKEINKRKNTKKANRFSLGTYTFYENDTISIHFWVNINKEDYYHIGFIEFTNNIVSETSNRNGTLRGGQSSKNFFTQYNEFFNTHQDNDCKVTHTSYKSTNSNDTVNRTIPITFKITDQIKEETYTHTHIREVDEQGWTSLPSINKKYALFSYNSHIDKECSDKEAQVPRLALKYDIDLDKQKEIVDIDLTMKAQSNKNNFMDDLNVNILKDGNYRYPTNTSSKIYYPNNISNPTKNLIANYIIKQHNITICADCLKTSLGFYDTCQYCGSTNISHNSKTEPVTICESCGWVTKGTYNFCKHCLSLDVNNVEVDYNKTYCQKCNKIVGDDYYSHCPLCGSPDTIYLDNKQQAYNLLSDEQNIEPIIIKTTETDINVCNINIPFNGNDNILDELKSLTLNLHYTNNNKGLYYYCPDCQTGGLGNFVKCPNCNGKIKNKRIEYNSFNAYLKAGNNLKKIDLMSNGEVNNSINIGSATKSIDILSLAKENDTSFELQFYINNPHVNLNIKNILDMDIDDNMLQSILDEINNFDFSIDNITVDCEFKDTNEWINLDNMNGTHHTGLKYKLKSGESITEPLELSDFNIPIDTFNDASLHIDGICETSGYYDIVVYITDKKTNETFTKEINNVNNILFDYDINLMNNIGATLDGLKVEIQFKNIKDINSIVLTNCYVLAQKTSTKPIDIDMSEKNISYVNTNNTYLIKNDKLWGLNDTQPYYLSDKQLQTGLLCYIDFGKIKSSEYIRLYDIYMTIYYKSKTGKITTDTIQAKKSTNMEQYINGELTKNNGEIWGSIRESEEALNNLEYEKLNIDSKGNISNSIPLRNTISQSFTYTKDNISQINFEYFGKIGYPSDIISIYLYDNYNNKPNKLIAQNKITMPLSKGIISIDFDADISSNNVYWVVLEDLNADVNNYHRFRFNNKTLGTLMVNDIITDKQSLCFGINFSNEIQSYYNLPVEWSIIPKTINYYSNTDDIKTEYGSIEDEMDDDIAIEYKMTNTFYRYNINESSNVSLSNMVIKNGYYFEEESITDIQYSKYEVDTMQLKTKVEQLIEINEEGKETSFMVCQDDEWVEITEEEYNMIKRGYDDNI